jgi:hypothetical protein
MFLKKAMGERTKYWCGFVVGQLPECIGRKSILKKGENMWVK